MSGKREKFTLWKIDFFLGVRHYNVEEVFMSKDRISVSELTVSKAYLVCRGYG